MGLTEERRKGCPSCGSREVAEILWGMPAFTDEVVWKREEGELVFGGCLLPDEDPAPRWECQSCRAQWRNRQKVTFPGRGLFG